MVEFCGKLKGILPHIFTDTCHDQQNGSPCLNILNLRAHDVCFSTHIFAEIFNTAHAFDVIDIVFCSILYDQYYVMLSRVVFFYSS